MIYGLKIWINIEKIQTFFLSTSFLEPEDPNFVIIGSAFIDEVFEKSYKLFQSLFKKNFLI